MPKARWFIAAYLVGVLLNFGLLTALKPDDVVNDDILLASIIWPVLWLLWLIEAVL